MQKKHRRNWKRPVALALAFAVAAGTVDLDVDFKIWVSGYGVIEKTIARGVNVTEVSKILAAYIC